MAKYKESKRKHDSGSVITTRSAFGSHREMMLAEGVYKSDKKIEGIVLKDDTGLYITTKDRLDSGLADPNRYSYKKREADIITYGLTVNEE